MLYCPMAKLAGIPSRASLATLDFDNSQPADAIKTLAGSHNVGEPAFAGIQIPPWPPKAACNRWYKVLRRNESQTILDP